MSDAKQIESREVYRGKIVRLSVDRVELPNGNVCDLEMIRHPGAAAVVPVDDQENVLLVRQYRYAASGWIYEVPAGKLDEGEDPAHCAAREIEEEVGVTARRWTPMGWVWTTPGFTDERIWLYLATGLETGRQSLQQDEVLRIERLPLADAVERARCGEIRDAKSVCALLRAPRFLDELRSGAELPGSG
jgi:ADP-ribose pyrophosphatase